MMLSVCIPVYNYDIRQLVSDLNDEIHRNHLNAEIILIDDASNSSFRETNETAAHLVQKYIQLAENVGRAAIRNLFLQYASGHYLLFFDCDVKILQPGFIKKYIDFLKTHPETDVVYGGRKSRTEKPTGDKLLRWRYSNERENLPAEMRNSAPYLSFQTNNFVVLKRCLSEVNFDEKFRDYGYEDLLFAMKLQERNIAVAHIENPVLNTDEETNTVFLAKVEESVLTVAKMLNDPETAPKLSDIRLVGTFSQLNNSGLIPVISFVFSILKSPIRKSLERGRASLKLLDFYKLGLLTTIMRTQNS